VRKQYHLWPGDEGIDAWDVDRLIELTIALPVFDVPLGELPEIDSAYWFDAAKPPTVRRIVEHVRLMNEVDPSWPVILGPDNRVMDGMHRIARALLEERPSVSAVRLAQIPPPDYRGCQPDDLPYDR
jgi:hypothetical protein